MSNELHELSTGDLEEVSGGIYRNFTPGPSITPSIPIPPPVLGLLGSGPVIPGGYGPIGTITPQYRALLMQAAPQAPSASTLPAR